MAFPDLVITGDGRNHLADLLAKRTGPGHRWDCRSSIVEWLGSKRAFDESTAQPWDTFRSSALADYYGAPFAEDDVTYALQGLRDKGLVNGFEPEEELIPVRPFLTRAGRDCVDDHGCDVQRYVESQKPRAGASSHVQVHGSGNQVAVGDHANQR
jgi:hypothetical protein